MTVDGGLGEDFINNTYTAAWTVTGGYLGNDCVLFGGDGNDTITDGGRETTINAGGGDDYVEFINTSSGVVNGGYYPKTLTYVAGDGNDTVVGLENAGEVTLQLLDTYSTVASGNNMLVKVGDGSILLVGRANKSVNINGAITTPTETSTSQPTETTTTPPAETNILQSTDNKYIYGGGNKNIITYTNEKINFHADFTGIGFNTTDFMINSSSGSLVIKNVRDKIMDVAVNNNTVAYAYYASGGGEINGGSFSVLEVIIGGNNSANTITAGSGGSSLWGGAGGNDIFTGGAGQDTFFYGKGDGADIINNAGSTDIVNLYDVSLNDLISANIEDNKISATFNTGGTLKINSVENLSATFKLSDGSFKFNHSTNQWQNV